MVRSMTISVQLATYFPDHFRVLILDNEVTLDAFIAEPPLRWVRLTAIDGAYRVTGEYPTNLTKAESDREEMNWDRVSDPEICAGLGELDAMVDLVAFGNNAGQGLSLAHAMPESLRAEHGAIIYGRSLPEQPVYEAAGYRRFCARDDLLSVVAPLAKLAGRQIALAFINTIEHNEQNYHAPWAG
jgi:hypothetical protein